MITSLIAEFLFVKAKFIALIILTAFIVTLSGCNAFDSSSSKVSELDYTVVEDRDLPTELKKLIDSKKENTIRLTYTTKDYIYLVAGYGQQPTSGYSIRVNDVYLGTDAIYVDVDLIGPESGEQVTELPTAPVIVLKMEKRDEPVVFQL
jgi:hypothetical protein